MFIQDEKNYMVLRATLAIAIGILVGGGAASMKNQACIQSETLPAYCLTEAPKARVAEGMIGGAFASGCAILMIELWGRYQKDS